MSKLRHEVEGQEGFVEKLRAVIPLLSDTLQVKDVYYVRTDGKMRAVNDRTYEADASDIEGIMDDDMFYDTTLDRLKQKSPVFCSALNDIGLESVMVTRIRRHKNIYGYLICAVKRSHRIWQENERAIIYYLAGLMAEDDINQKMIFSS
jgi:hypothetical protein